MGLLPDDRTITLTPGDPFPSALGNELQDMFKGDKRKAYTRMVWPRVLNNADKWDLAGVTASGVSRMAITSNASVISTRLEIELESGELLTGFKVYVCGNGTADLDGGVQYAATFTTGNTTIYTFTGTNTPSGTWTLLTASVVNTAVPAAAGSVTEAIVDVNGSGYSISMMQLLLRRP